VRSRGRTSSWQRPSQEFPLLPLDYALALVHLYREKGDAKYERAALRYLERYLAEANPSLEDVAGLAVLLAEKKPVSKGWSGKSELGRP
jgi:hypothetical protein